PFVVQNHTPIRVHSWFKTAYPTGPLRRPLQPESAGPRSPGREQRVVITEAAGPTRNAESIKREAL
ncbi:MAG: hypothetical protein ACK55P_07220, partial [Planctomyces sp.]